MSLKSEQETPLLPEIRVFTFGEFTVERLVTSPIKPDQPRYECVSNEMWQSRGTAISLLKVLLCKQRRRASRDELIDALWSENEQAKMKNVGHAFDAAVSILRNVLRTRNGQSLLITQTGGDDHACKLADQERLWVDADAFEALISQAFRADDSLPWWQQARALVRGEFLEDNRYSDWARSRRQTLTADQSRMACGLADCFRKADQPDIADEVLQRHIAINPIDEDALCLLMSLLEQREKYHAAWRLYQRTREESRKDGFSLTPRIHALARRVRDKLVTLDANPSYTVIHPVSPITMVTKIPEVPLQALTQAGEQSDALPLLSQAITQGIIGVIHELERALQLNTSDSVTRRAVLAHLLGIPPALFALDEHFINSLTKAMLFLENDTLDLYEDILVMGWDSFRRSKSPEIIHRIDAYVDKLATLSLEIPKGKREHWQSLLCRFSQLSTRIAQHTMNEQRALSMARQAIEAARELNDAELIASAFYRRSRVHLEYSNTATDEGRKQRHFALARADVDAALAYAEQVRIPLKGNIYLIAAEIYALLADNDASLRTQCEGWQHKVATLVYGGNIEDDGTFLKLDPTALHHEKAKTLLQFGRLQDARRELETARRTLPPNLLTWQMNMHLTETNLSLAERDVERSAASGIQAYTLAQAIYSHKGKVEAKHLFTELQRLDPINSSVHELAMVIGGES